MEVSALTLRVLLLFFPGVLCAMLVDALTVHRRRDSTEFLTHSFVLGLTSYLLLYVGQWGCETIAKVAGLPAPGSVTFVQALLNDKIKISWEEIVLAAGTALALGFTVSASINHKLLYRASRKLGITRRRGGLDIWGTLFDSPGTNWVIARDLEHGFTYFGFLEAFSETADRAEILLSDVAVVESATGTKLYDSGALYFAQDVKALSIELIFPSADPGARHGRPEIPSVRKVPGGNVQPGRVESQPAGPPAEHRDSSAGSEGAAASARKRKPKRRR